MPVKDLRLVHSAIILDEAVEALIGTGTHAERLIRAAHHLIGITPDEFEPYPEIKATFVELQAELSRTPGERDGKIAATIEKAGTAKRRAMAKGFIDLDRAIRETGNRTSEVDRQRVSVPIDLSNLPFTPSVFEDEGNKGKRPQDLDASNDD